MKKKSPKDFSIFRGLFFANSSTRIRMGDRLSYHPQRLEQQAEQVGMEL